MVDGKHVSVVDDAACTPEPRTFTIMCTCSERPIICHFLYNGAMEVKWDDEMIDYLRQHIADRHA